MKDIGTNMDDIPKIKGMRRRKITKGNRHQTALSENKRRQRRRKERRFIESDNSQEELTLTKTD